MQFMRSFDCTVLTPQPRIPRAPLPKLRISFSSTSGVCYWTFGPSTVSVMSTTRNRAFPLIIRS
jgi:hypothetical protein